jgi:hypothetical protein
MKTKILILTAILAGSVSLLFAGSPKTYIIKSNSITIEFTVYDDYSWLAPETPREATFEDSEPRPAPDIARLAPITPKEATFNEACSDPSTPSEMMLSLQNIAPVAPKEADFDETAEEDVSGSHDLWNPEFFSFSNVK